ncbi:MAG: hypothetical protein M3483_04215, partial [Gemmatimonadota bacterium]|nr:hypothetical protein [Gemmatimonadota bacterium]
ATAELIEHAVELAEDGRWGDVREALLERLPADPDSPGLLAWLGIASRELGVDGEAYEFFRASLAAGVDDPFLLANIGAGLATFDDPEAERALRLAALTAPTLSFARLSYGAYLVREGLIPEAMEELEAARSLAPDDLTIRAELALALLIADRKAEGLGELEAALGTEPDDGWLRGILGMALLEAGREEEGAEELHRAAALRPEDVELQLLFALAAVSQGWEDEGWNALARAEAAAEEVDAVLLREVEDALGGGARPAQELLRTEMLPPALRERLLQRL